MKTRTLKTKILVSIAMCGVAVAASNGAMAAGGKASEHELNGLRHHQMKGVVTTMRARIRNLAEAHETKALRLAHTTGQKANRTLQEQASDQRTVDEKRRDPKAYDFQETARDLWMLDRDIAKFVAWTEGVASGNGIINIDTVRVDYQQRLGTHEASLAWEGVSKLFPVAVGNKITVKAGDGDFSVDMDFSGMQGEAPASGIATLFAQAAKELGDEDQSTFWGEIKTDGFVAQLFGNREITCTLKYYSGMFPGSQEYTIDLFAVFNEAAE